MQVELLTGAVNQAIFTRLLACRLPKIAAFASDPTKVSRVADLIEHALHLVSEQERLYLAQSSKARNT